MLLDMRRQPRLFLRAINASIAACPSSSESTASWELH